MGGWGCSGRGGTEERSGVLVATKQRGAANPTRRQHNKSCPAHLLRAVKCCHAIKARFPQHVGIVLQLQSAPGWAGAVSRVTVKAVQQMHCGSCHTALRDARWNSTDTQQRKGNGAAQQTKAVHLSAATMQAGAAQEHGNTDNKTGASHL